MITSNAYAVSPSGRSAATAEFSGVFCLTIRAYPLRTNCRFFRIRNGRLEYGLQGLKRFHTHKQIVILTDNSHGGSAGTSDFNVMGGHRKRYCRNVAIPMNLNIISISMKRIAGISSHREIRNLDRLSLFILLFFGIESDRTDS